MRRQRCPPMIAAMVGTRSPVSVRLDLQPDTEQISGCIEHPDGTRRPFWSWLELMHELEAAVADATGPAIDTLLAPGDKHAPDPLEGDAR